MGPASCTQTLHKGWPEPAASEKGSKGQRAVLAGWHRWGQALDPLLRLGRNRPPRRHPAGCSLLASHLPAL